MKDNKYELILILSVLPVDEAEKVKNEIFETLKKRVSNLTQEEKWGERPLFHEKMHQKKGVFHYIKFDAPGSAVDQINNDLRLNQSVLKFMVSRAA